jgi:hypothetical protein
LFLKKVELYPFFIFFNEEKINGNGGGSVMIRVVEVMAREREKTRIVGYVILLRSIGA